MIKKLIIMVMLTSANLHAMDEKVDEKAEKPKPTVQVPSDEDSLEAMSRTFWPKATTPAGLATLDKKFSAWYTEHLKQDPAGESTALAKYQAMLLQESAKKITGGAAVGEGVSGQEFAKQLAQTAQEKKEARQKRHKLLGHRSVSAVFAQLRSVDELAETPGKSLASPKASQLSEE